MGGQSKKLNQEKLESLELVDRIARLENILAKSHGPTLMVYDEADVYDELPVITTGNQTEETIAT